MAAKAGKSPPMRHRFGLTLWRAARLVVLDPAGAKLVLFVVVAALAAIGVHVDPARPFHLAHMIDQILRVVSHIAAFRLVAVFQPRLAPRGLGDALRLRVFVVLLAVASLGGICFGFAGIVDHGRLLSGIARKRAGPDRRSSGRRRE